MSKEKTHYRKVFKSDHLSIHDLEDLMERKAPLIFTIKEVKQEWGTKVAGKSINANIAYFEEKIKPLVLNATNSKILSKLAGSGFVENWNNIPVELYIDYSAKLMKEVVGGVRIKDTPPVVLSKEEVEEAKVRISNVSTLEELTGLYNANPQYKTNKEVIKMLSDRKAEIVKP